jgi:Ca2+/Na+ antiporter
MNLPIWVGYLVFFLLPTFLWLLVVAGAKRKGVKARAWAVIAGSDNRLSLSRLQAFAWTLIIFGSFAAAMAIHTKILAANPKDLNDAQAVVKTATENADKLKPNVATTATAAKAANDLYNAAQVALREAETKLAGLAADASPESKQQAQRAVDDSRINLKAKVDTKASADRTAAEAKADSEKADQDLKSAVARAKSYEWVGIPAALLALAGIAIGSGVFSSLISAVNAEDKTACVTSLGALPQANLKEHAPDANPTKNPNALSIRGKDFGTSGTVRLNNERLPILLWKNDGAEILVDVKDGVSYKTLTVDTANGKLSYDLTGQMPGLTLGLPKIDYEFSDFFRDDKDPSVFSLMKFQMFGWTFIAIVIYVYLFLADLRPDLESLPVVPASIVILTGLSQGGYLSGKAVSGMEKPGGN